MTTNRDADSSCPLAYFVRGTPHMITRGYGCGATGGRCSPSVDCDNLVRVYEECDESYFSCDLGD
jgi:hypothetical protein